MHHFMRITTDQKPSVFALCQILLSSWVADNSTSGWTCHNRTYRL